jgi:hypothetical protein
MRSSPPRFLILIFVIPLACWLFLQARSSWRNYWLLKDGQPGMAVVTKEYWGGHGQVIYRYVVNQQEFTGISKRNWQEEKYKSVRPGEEAVVYFSASHPWLSLLYKPDVIVEILPALIPLVLGVFVVMTAVNPKSKWSLNLSDRKENDAA